VSNGQAKPYVRRNIWSLDPSKAFSSKVTLNYAKAVGIMKKRPATDPTSWAYQANVHGSYAPVPPGASWNQCQHATWYFLPWHRMYIFFFEKIVKAAIKEAGADPTGWALPYWNYSDGPQPPANTLPLALRAKKLPDGTNNPLYVAYPHRNANTPADKQNGLGLKGRGINDGGQIPPTYLTYTQAFNFTNYSFPTGPRPGFGGPHTGLHHDGGADSMPFGELENQPHNNVHVFVGGSGGNNCQGGWMTDPNCAAQDPVFWLHHSNIDRLWNRWTISQGHIDPAQSAWLDRAYKFYDPDTRGFRQIKVKDVVHSLAQLGYRYDDDPPPVAQAGRRVPVQAQAAAAPEVPVVAPTVLGSTGPVTFSSHASSVTGQMAAKPAMVARLASAAAKASTKEIILTVEQVDRDDDAGLLYDVYLNLPDDAQPDPNSPYFVGHMPFFGHKPSAEGPQHDHPGMAFSYRITNLVNEQKAQGIWSDKDFKVTLVAGGHREPGKMPTVAAASAAKRAGKAPGAVRAEKVTITAE
jgi:hypothetical protein